VNVVRKALGAEVLAHEFAHAAMGFCRERGIDPTQQGPVRTSLMPMDCGEERFCYAL
jgi:hypothetical protein